MSVLHSPKSNYHPWQDISTRYRWKMCGLSLADQCHCHRKKSPRKESVSTATKSRPRWQQHPVLWAHVTCVFQSLSPLSFPSFTTNTESSYLLTGNLANTSSLPPSLFLKPNLWSNPPTKIRCLPRDELSHSLRRHFLVLWLERMKN